MPRSLQDPAVFDAALPVVYIQTKSIDAIHHSKGGVGIIPPPMLDSAVLSVNIPVGFHGALPFSG